MTPYAIAHMKIGLKLLETGYKFGSGERARIYLTNALEPPKDFSETFEQMAPALAHEASAVNDVKRHHRFTVVIGNPPYSKMSANLSEHAVALIEPFRYVAGERIVERGALAHEINLQDDYVKFYALMFSELQEAGIGVGSYISNFRYLDSPSLRGLRHRALTLFRHLDVLHMGGHVADRNTLTVPDDNVFDIEQGVAIALLRRAPGMATSPCVRYGRLLGDRESKYGTLTTNSTGTLATESLHPSAPFYTFRPAGGREEAEFRAWPGIDALYPTNSGCVITSRDNLAIGFSVDEVLAKVSLFANSPAGDEQIQEQIGFSVKAKWDVEACKRLIKLAGVKREFVRPILYRPFDIRFVYYLPQLLDTPSRLVSDLLVDRSNMVLLTPKIKTTQEFTHALVSRDTAEKKACSHDRATQMFPLWVDSVGGRVANAGATELGGSPAETFSYCYAILHSDGYRRRYGQVLRDVFPRVPAATGQLFSDLSVMGSELIALHLLESSRLNQGIVRYFGIRDRMVESISHVNGTVSLDKKQTCGFVGVATAVWNFHIGGYQVCEKWLKDRKGRTLSEDDIAHYQKTVVAISETIRLMKAIDEVIEKHGGWPGAFVTGPAIV